MVQTPRVALVAAIRAAPDLKDGVTSYTTALLGHLRSPDFIVEVWAQRAAGAEPDLDRSCPWVLRLWRPGALLGIDLLRNLRKRRPDLLHLQFEFSVFGGAIALVSLFLALVVSRIVGQRILVTIHQVPGMLDMTHSTLRRLGVRLPVRLARLLIRLALSSLCACADLVIVHAEVFRERLVGEYSREFSTVRVIPHGVSETTYKESSNGKFLLLFGYLNWYKGTDIAIRAFREVGREFPEWRLVIAGGPAPGRATRPEYQAFRKELATLAMPMGAQVEFLGYVANEHVPDLLRAAGIVLFPYRILFSSSGPLAEVIGYHRPFVISQQLRPLLPAWPFWCLNDAEHWAATLRMLMADEALIQNAKVLAGKLASARTWPVVASQTVETYGDLLKLTAPPALIVRRSR